MSAPAAPPSWCSAPLHPPPLTEHQQDLANQCCGDSSSPLVQALVGPSGTGKATIATHVAAQQQTRTIWLHASSESTLRASYVALIREYAPKEKALGTQSTRQLADQIARVVLSNQQPQLLVHQDVAVPPAVFFSKWAIPIPNNSRATVLLTSNLPAYQAWKQDHYQCIPVQAKLSMQDAQSLLAIEEEEDDDNLLSLLGLLQHRPLAVRLVGAQLSSLGIPTAKFLRKLQQFRDQHTSKTSPTKKSKSREREEAEEDLSWFWSIATDHIVDRSALKVLSMIHHDCIPEALIGTENAWLLEQGQILQQGHSPQTYSIAPELQQAIRQRDREAPASAVKAVQACLKTVKDDKHAVVHYLPHLRALQSNVRALRLPNEGESFPREAYANVLLQMGLVLQRAPFADYERAMGAYRQGVDALNSSTIACPVAKRLYYRLGTCARLQGDHAQAKSYCVKALELYGYHDLQPGQEVQLVDHDEPTSEWNVLSQLFHTCGHASWQEAQVVEARVYFEHELAVKQTIYGVGQPHDRVARTLNNLGSVCRDAGDLMAAKDYSLQSLQMQHQLGKGDNLETATTLNNLGSLSYSMCEYAQAQDFLEQALAMKTRCYQQQQRQPTTGEGPQDLVQNLDVAETYYNLGMLADHLSHYDKAQEHYEASLSCKYAVFGNDAQNAQIATSLSSLALSAMNHGEYQKAEQAFQQSLEMQQAFYLGEGNMEQVRTLHGLGMINYHLGRLQQSRKYHKAALEMQQEIEAKEKRRSHTKKKTYLADPRTANMSQIMQNLGNLAHNLGEYDNAREFYEQGLKLYSQVSVDSTKDEHLQYMLSNLKNLSSTSSYDAARTYYEKALEMKEFLYGEETANSDLAFTLRSLAMLNDNAGKHEEAKECYYKALKMLHHFYGDKEAVNAEIAGVLDGLGAANFNLGNYQKSQKWLQQALAMKETVYGDAKNNDLATSHVSLGTLAQTLGNYEKAREHLERAYEMQKAVFGDLAGEQNIELGVTANCLANLYRDLGEHEKALALYQTALQLMGKDNPYLASVLMDLGECYRQQGDYEKANACFQESMRLQKQLYGEDSKSPEVAALLMYLGKLNTDLAKHDEAQACLERALEMQRRVMGHEDKKGDVVHGEIANTLQALGDLLRAKGEPERAQEYLEQAISMRKSVYGDVKTVEMAQAVRSLGEIYSDANEEEQRDSCQNELSDLCSNAPLVAQALNQSRQTAQQAACTTATTTGQVTKLRHPGLKQSATTELDAVADCATDWSINRTALPSAGKEEAGKQKNPQLLPNSDERKNSSAEEAEHLNEGDLATAVCKGAEEYDGKIGEECGSPRSAQTELQKVDGLVGTVVTLKDEQKEEAATLVTEISTLEDHSLDQHGENRPTKQLLEGNPKTGTGTGKGGQRNNPVELAGSEEVDQGSQVRLINESNATHLPGLQGDQLELAATEGQSQMNTDGATYTDSSYVEDHVDESADNCGTGGEALRSKPRSTKNRGGEGTAHLQRESSTRKTNSNKRLSIVQKQPGEQPKMDWTDSKLVKRKSTRHVHQKKVKGESAAAEKTESSQRPIDWTDAKLVKRVSMRLLQEKKMNEQDDKINKAGSFQRPMDWTDAKLVRRESMKYLQQKKMKGGAAFQGENVRSNRTEGPKKEQQNQGRPKGSPGCRDAQVLKTTDAKSKLQEQVNSKPKVHETSEAQPKLRTNLSPKPNEKANEGGAENNRREGKSAKPKSQSEKQDGNGLRNSNSKENHCTVGNSAKQDVQPKGKGGSDSETGKPKDSHRTEGKRAKQKVQWEGKGGSGPVKGKPQANLGTQKMEWKYRSKSEGQKEKEAAGPNSTEKQGEVRRDASTGGSASGGKAQKGQNGGVQQREESATQGQSNEGLTMEKTVSDDHKQKGARVVVKTSEKQEGSEAGTTSPSQQSDAARNVTVSAKEQDSADTTKTGAKLEAKDREDDDCKQESEPETKTGTQTNVELQADSDAKGRMPKAKDPEEHDRKQEGGSEAPKEEQSQALSGVKGAKIVKDQDENVHKGETTPETTMSKSGQSGGQAKQKKSPRRATTEDQDENSEASHDEDIPKEVEVTSMRTVDTEQSSIGEATHEDGSNKRDSSGKAGKNHNPELGDKEKRGNKSKTSAEPSQNADPLTSSSGFSAGSKARRRGNMGEVSDMPVRRRKEEPVATTCGCLPFGWFK